MNISEIEKYLKIVLPDGHLTKLLEGGMSYAYEIANKIIRIPKTMYAEQGYEMEYAILEYVRNIVDCVKLPLIQIIRQPFFHTVHNKIEGIYWDATTYLSKDFQTRDSLAEDCAVFFAQLHSADVTKINTHLLDIHRIKNNMVKYLADYFSVKEMDQILSFTESLYTLGDKVLVHRDFYQDNFLLDDNYRLKAVLDFGNSGFYNYMFDFKALASWEESMKDFFTRIASRYERITGRIIDIETIHKIDIHNYISFLTYFVKNKNVKDEKIGATVHFDEHVAHIKEKMKRYV